MMNPLELGSRELTQAAGATMCLVLSAVFSGSEAAIATLGTMKAQALLENRPSARRAINLWLHHPSRVMTTLLVLRRVAMILAVAIVTDLMRRLAVSDAVAFATAVTAVIVLVFCDIGPKSLAKAHAESLSVPSLRFVLVLHFLVFPIVWFFNTIATRFSALLGHPEKPPPAITEAEIEYLVNAGEKAGVLEETKKEMIVSVFEFGLTKVREIMTPRPDIRYLSVDADLDQSLEMAVESGMSRIPICEDHDVDHILGILLVKDLLRVARVGHVEKFSIRSIMRDVYFIPESKLIMDVFKELKATKNHIAIVIDEHGGTAGLVTMEDLLEEIVGEIQDEYDVEEAEMIELEPGIYEVNGSTNIDEFLEFFELDEKELAEKRDEDLDTIAGWVTALSGEMPEVGKTVRLGPLNVEVIGVERNRIRRLRVSRVLGQGA